MGFISVLLGWFFSVKSRPGRNGANQEAYIFRFQRNAEKEKTLREYLHSSVFTEYKWRRRSTIASICWRRMV